MAPAGADVTAICSPKKAAIMENRSVSVDSILEKISGVDVLITEGYKHGAWPKIVLYRYASGKPPALPPEECFAVVSDIPLNISVPLFVLRCTGLADLILRDMRENNLPSKGVMEMKAPKSRDIRKPSFLKTTGLAAGSGTLK
jgi:molybdopterin-guanine dinucleotide biosynthesis protein MobB